LREDILVFVGRRVNGWRSGNLNDMAGLLGQQGLSRQSATLFVVCPDDGNLLTEEAVKGDDGQIDFPTEYNQYIESVRCRLRTYSIFLGTISNRFDIVKIIVNHVG
jgi:hypothetical protein